MFTGTPTAVRACAKESVKKLKYLKNPRNRKFRAIDGASSDFRWSEFDERAMLLAHKKSTTVEMMISPRNRQSHHP